MSRSTRQTILFALALTVLFTVMVVGTYYGFVTQAPGANDFYPRWRGAQLFWRDGVDPYSQAATEAIQRGMYGRLAFPEEDQVLFVYPFYTVLLLLPLVWLPYGWVQAIWLVLIMFALVGGTLIILRLLAWRPPPWLLAATILWSLLYYSSARTIILGQFAGPIFLCLMGCLLLLKQERDIGAGVLLALTTFKPQMIFLLIPALMLWGMGQRRWRFVVSFVAAMGVLVGVSFLLLPGWLIGFFDQLTSYTSYTVEGDPMVILTEEFVPWLGPVVGWLLRGLLVGWLLWAWWRLPNTAVSSPHFLMILSITLVVSNLVVNRTATTNYVVLYLPLFWGLMWLSGRQWGNTAVLIFYLLSFIGMWALFIGTLEGNAEHSWMFLPLPFGLAIWLLLARHPLLNISRRSAHASAD